MIVESFLDKYSIIFMIASRLVTAPWSQFYLCFILKVHTKSTILIPVLEIELMSRWIQI